MKIRTEKTGGLWHGYLEGHPEIDETALTEEKAREKVQRIVKAHGLEGDTRNTRTEDGIRRTRR